MLITVLLLISANQNQAKHECKSANIRVASRSQLLEVPELAAFLKVKPRTIYEMVAQNRIPDRKPSGSNTLRFDLDEIIAWTTQGITNDDIG